MNHKSFATVTNYYVTLSYKRSIREGLNLSGKVYRNFEDYFNDYQQFPPKYVTMTPTGPAAMPEKWLAEESAKDSRTGVEVQTTYKIGDSNTVFSGVTYEEMKQYDYTTKENVLTLPDFLNFPRAIIPLPALQKWPDEFTEDTEKINFKAVFVEDIWDVTDNLRFTTGVRYDRYSNFGGEFSPRVGLTWEYIRGYDLKLLYSHAFRSPSFYELFQVYYGNPDLEPETRDMYEVSLGADFNSSLSVRLTGYYSKGKDTITLDPLVSPPTYVNFGKSRNKGIEVEIKYDFGRGTYLAWNYNYGRTPSAKMPSGMKSRSWTSPRHMNNIMANIRLSRYLNFFSNCHFEDGFRRQFADSRDDMSGYAIVDATLIAKKFLKGYEGLEFRASVYNLLDKEYTSPQDDRLPYDLPMPGINFLLEMKYRF